MSRILGSHSHGLFRRSDPKLKAYGKLGGSPANITARSSALKNLKDSDFAREQGSFINPLAEAIAIIEDVKTNGAGLTPDQQRERLKAAFRLFSEGRDRYVEAKRGPNRDDHSSNEPDFNAILGELQRTLNQYDLRHDATRELVEEDLARLRLLMNDLTVDPLLRQILTEVLANEALIYFQETKGVASGAVLLTGAQRVNALAAFLYRVDVQLDQKEGTDERLSSLLHEITHISNQVIFGNTGIHLAFREDLADAQVLALSNIRTGQLQALLNLLQNRPPGSFTFTPEQLAILNEKLIYPIDPNGKNSLLSYATAFKKKGQLSDEQFQRIKDLVAAGANNSLVEFDTVINQALFLLNAWGVPQDDPFFMALKEVAQQAYDWRNTGAVPRPLITA